MKIMKQDTTQINTKIDYVFLEFLNKKQIYSCKTYVEDKLLSYCHPIIVIYIFNVNVNVLYNKHIIVIILKLNDYCYY